MLIPKRVFKVSKSASREMTRYAINGVLLRREPDGGCVAATTDGRRLTVSRWRDDDQREEYPAVGLDVEPVEGFQAIVPTADWDEAGKVVPKRSPKDVLLHSAVDEKNANGKVTFASTDLDRTRKLECTPVEGHFPKFEEVIPKMTVGEDAVEIGCNPEYLAEAAKIVAEISTNEESKGVVLTIPVRPDRPFIVSATAGGVETKSVIMPVNLGYDSNSPCTPLQKAAMLTRIVEAIANLQYIDDRKDRDKALSRAIGDAHEALGTMGYEETSRAQFEPVEGFTWPIGLTDTAIVSRDTLNRLYGTYAAAKAKQEDAEDETAATKALAAGKNRSYPDLRPLSDVEQDEQPETTTADDVLSDIDLDACGDNLVDSEPADVPYGEAQPDVEDADEETDEETPSFDQFRTIIAKFNSVSSACGGPRGHVIRKGDQIGYAKVQGESLTCCTDCWAARVKQHNPKPAPASSKTTATKRKRSRQSTPSPRRANGPKRVSIRALRKDAEKVAPVSGARCRLCGASAHRAKFSPKDKWLVVNGAVYCPDCEQQADG